VFPFSSPFPTILGHESVGRVVAVGRKVRNLKIGDLVTRVGAPPSADGKVTATWGGFAEYGIARDHWAMCADGLPEADWRGHRVNQVVPPSVDPRTAPMFTTWRETLSYLLRMGAGPGQDVLVIGSGGNGLAFARHAVNLGAAGVRMVGSPGRRAVAERQGVLDYVSYDDADRVRKLSESCPEGFHCVIDAVGKKNQADAYVPLVKPGGKLAIYGMDDFGRVSICPQAARGSFTLWKGGYDESETHQKVIELVLQRKLDASAWYDKDRPYALADIAAAFRDLGRKSAVKALIRLSERE
jgi:threonine dehydrogenase-like Zn-dependent dehydrogenase